MRRLGTTVLVVVGMALAGCGSQSATGIGQSASSQLSPKVEAVHAAVASGDSAGATRSLAELRLLVTSLLQSEDLTEDQATEVLAAAADVEAQLALMPTTQVPPTVTTSIAPGEQGGDRDDDDRGQGKRKEAEGNKDDD